jgi:SAM-dependent methyltransferase
LYILAVRERSDKLVRELVVGHPAPFVSLMMKKRGKEIDYEAKTVMPAGPRYIVCISSAWCTGAASIAKTPFGGASVMRVLDIGCGMGDVTMLVAELVGPADRVVSIDLDQATIETAQRGTIIRLPAGCLHHRPNRCARRRL